MQLRPQSTAIVPCDGSARRHRGCRRRRSILSKSRAQAKQRRQDNSTTRHCHCGYVLPITPYNTADPNRYLCILSQKETLLATLHFSSPALSRPPVFPQAHLAPSGKHFQPGQWMPMRPYRANVDANAQMHEKGRFLVNPLDVFRQIDLAPIISRCRHGAWREVWGVCSENTEVCAERCGVWPRLRVGVLHRLGPRPSASDDHWGSVLYRGQVLRASTVLIAIQASGHLMMAGKAWLDCLAEEGDSLSQ